MTIYEVGIRSFPPYPHSDGGRMGLCAVFRIHSCGFTPDSFDVRLSSLLMVAALVRWSFVILAQQFFVCLLQQTLPILFGFGDGGARMPSRLWLVLVFVVVARWSKYLFIIFIMF